MNLHKAFGWKAKSVESGDVNQMGMTIRDWLEMERQPADVYELLGRLRFDPDRQQLLAAVRSAYAELLPYQNHADPKIAQRAIELQRELGNAENILSNPEKLRAHHKTIVNNIHEAYAKAKGGGEDWSQQRLQFWLSQDQRVHATRAEMIARFLLPAAEPPVDFELPQTQEVKPAIRQPTSEEGRHETEPSPPLTRRRVFEAPSTKARPQPKAPLPQQPPPAPTPAQAQQPLIEQPTASAVEIDAAPLPTIQKRKRRTWSRILATKAIPRNKFLRVALTVFIVVGAGLLIGRTTLYVTNQLEAAKAEEAWSAALAAADKDLLGKYARQGFDAAREQAASARTQGAEGNCGEATRLFREALVTVNRATSVAIVARNAERAKQEALAEFDPTVRSAAYDRGEEILTEANAAMSQTRFDDAEHLFDQAAKSFAQALAEINELGHAQEAWSGALAGADRGLLRSYAAQALDDAQQKANSAKTQAATGHSGDAATLYREAVVTLNSATALAMATRRAAVAEEEAKTAREAALTRFETDVRSVSFERGERLLAEGSKAMKEDNPESAEQLFGQAAEFFAQAHAEAPVANALGKAQEARNAAEALFQTDVRSASFYRGEQLLAAGSKAVKEHDVELAERVFGQAAELFAKASMEAPVANALGKAQAAWSAALAAADSDLLRKYAYQTFDAAQQKAASAVTLVTAGKPEEATTVYRDALVMLHHATGESLVPQLQMAISNKDRLAATELLAKINPLMPQELGFADLRQQVEALPLPLAIAPFEAQRAEQYQRAWAEHFGIPMNITNSVGIRLVLIPPGEFLMGSPADDRDASSDEEPQHNVRITNAFYLGVTEVTQAEYERVKGRNPSRFKGDPQRPVESLAWDDAEEFCRKLSEKEGVTYRLPTEAEWEYACRAGTTTRYCFGDDEASLREYAWYDVNSDRTTHPVGEKKPNAWGLCDMHGNVWEWCADWYDGDYYASSAGSDPTGRVRGFDRVHRGGFFFNTAGCCRSAYRHRSSPRVRFHYLGFRVARSPSGR